MNLSRRQNAKEEVWEEETEDDRGREDPLHGTESSRRGRNEEEKEDMLNQFLKVR